MNWLKMIGSAKDPLDNDWLQQSYERVDTVRFTTHKRPTGVSVGDRLVLYAANWLRFFAVAVVTLDAPVHDPRESNDRWPWSLDVEMRIAVPRLELAPHLRELTGVAARPSGSSLTSSSTTPTTSALSRPSFARSNPERRGAGGYAARAALS